MSTRNGQIRSELVTLLPRLRRFALALSHNRHDADDLVQTAIVRALAQEPAAQLAERLDSWMYKVLRNLWIDERRRRTVRGSAEPVESLIDLAGEDGRTNTEVRSELALAQKVFDRMSPELRTSAVLVIVNELSYREAADVLEVPIGTVMSRVSRARRVLVESLADTPNGDAGTP
ncbi:MAG: RNA polymerase sigma factor [Alphaproteobacteria bacterium]|nr:RNA polymerase sigma factor [Alphaproteobacteria bacterium]